MANRFAPPARSFFDNSMAKSRLIARESAQQNLAGAQTINVPNVTLSSSSSTTWGFGVIAATTLTAGVSSPTTTITVASATSFSVGSVVIVGGTGAGEIQWVSGVSGTTITLTPGLVNTHGNGGAVSVVAAIQSEVYTAQDPTGVDLGTTVVVSGSNLVSFPSGSCTATMTVICVRTGFQYAGIDKVAKNAILFGSSPFADIVGPQIQALASPSNGSAGAYVAAASADAVTTLEWPTIAYDYTLSSGSSAGATSITTSGVAAASEGMELMVGDDDEPAELVYGYWGPSGGGFTITNTPLQVAHASGATVVNPTSTGQSNWTFIPYYGAYAATGSPSITFYVNTLTIDPR